MNEDRSVTSGPQLQNSIFVDCAEHFLVGMKGKICRRSDGHFVHTNIDTDVIISEPDSPAQNSDYPSELFHIMERFCLGMKRCLLKFEGQKLEGKASGLPGWLTVSENWQIG